MSALPVCSFSCMKKEDADSFDMLLTTEILPEGKSRVKHRGLHWPMDP